MEAVEVTDKISKLSVTEDGFHSENVISFIDGVPAFQKSIWPTLKALTHLDVSNCKISELPDAIGDISALITFQASHNTLISLPSSISQLKNLSKLILSYNKVSKLPSSFAELNALDYLDLSHNELNSPPSCLEVGCIKITYLDISHNRIKEWNVGPMCGYGLKYLSCSHNDLEVNPAWLWGDFCHSLEELDLSFNSLSNPACKVKTYTLWRIGVAVTLRNLDFSNCGLSSNHIHLVHHLKSVKKLNLGNMTKFESLRISNHLKNNVLWQFSVTPLQCSANLTELYLCNVGLSALPDDIGCLEALETLDCQENAMQWLPDSFSNLKNLRVAIFSCNQLLFLSSDFGNLRCLEELWVNNNGIRELPLSFTNLERLKWLDLYSNDFEDFPPSLNGLLPNLSGLDLEQNQFESNDSVNARDENSVTDIKTLKEALRRHPQAKVCGELTRQDGLRPPPKSSEVDSDQDEYSSDSEYNKDCDLSDPGDNGELCETDYQDEENWDLDDTEDDFYDPTCATSEPTVCMPARALIIHELVLRPDSFCPSDIHPSPSIRADKDPFAPEDGQFEDA